MLASATPLGHPVPAEEHAVSVSLPAWEDVCDYERGASRVVQAMKTGYPRFFVHLSIQSLAKHCLENYGDPHQDAAYLFPTLNIAKSCSDFLSLRNTSCRIHKVSLLDSSGSTRDAADPLTPTVFFAVLLPMEAASLGKQFWQHTGDGISSRFAERCLALIHKANTEPQWPPPRSTANARASSSRGLSRNKHYNKGNSDVLESIIRPTPPASSTSNGPSLALDEDEEVEAMPRAYVEERYGRNLGSIHGPLAKAALKRRIAGVLREQSSPITQQNLPNLSKLSLKEEESALNKAGGRATAHATSTRGVLNLAAEDVYLYPGGMSAIFHAHQILLERARREGRTAGKSICFGFPYTDTLKILQKWGPGCHFFGSGLDTDIDQLDKTLEADRAAGLPPPLSLFTEFPSNPLLRCASLPRLRALSRKYGFALVVDETIGTFANVEVLPWCDIAVSSLTKVFSGDCNVMGGSMVLNPDSKYYADLKMIQADVYEDTYYDEDALFLERNSRDFAPRIEKIDRNTEIVCDWFWDQLQSGQSPSLQDVCYTKFATPDSYLRCIRSPSEGSPQRPGWGGLFSIVLKTEAAGRAFYDALACEKGPSLGTNFTLACPYTLLAHWSELEWASDCGVPSNLVRISVGLEDPETLLQWCKDALAASDAAMT